ncbi:hypothetical protein QFZ75_003766 [Streptomyces sp. V3I8]|uniref:hypothetical protein n=1 Tax=Streptomyces sp. V3I8 TaxID=3042279 RepID=UPI00277EFFE2|nr:hypothetical protein [Streptomyces sp. V3I8]MDQ1037350.1 hypothetical protein [Streptomyces sp. V3I8]
MRSHRLAPRTPRRPARAARPARTARLARNTRPARPSGAAGLVRPTRRPTPRSAAQSAQQRLLVVLAALLCALCVVGSAGGHTGSRTAPPAAVSTESGLEHPHDLLDTALRPVARQGHRPLVPLRPAHRSAAERPRPRVRSLPASHHAPSPRARRCMVLRC